MHHDKHRDVTFKRCYFQVSVQSKDMPKSSERSYFLDGLYFSVCQEILSTWNSLNNKARLFYITRFLVDIKYMTHSKQVLLV